MGKKEKKDKEIKVEKEKPKSERQLKKEAEAKKKSEEQEKRKKEQEKKRSVKKDMIELFPIIAEDDKAFLKKDGTYIDLYKIVCRDLVNRSNEDIIGDIVRFAGFEKIYDGDHKIIGINFPTNTKQQQRYYSYKIEETKNPVFRKFLQKTYNRLHDFEFNSTEREFYLMIFAKNKNELYERRNSVAKALMPDKLVESLSMKDKEAVMKKISNKSTIIFHK